MNEYYVYALYDPVNNFPFYIGKGKGDRMWQHFSEKKSSNRRKTAIIQALKDLGLELRADVIVDGLEEDAAYEIEHSIIKYIHQTYPGRITNVTGVRKPPSRKGAKLSDSQRDKMKGRISPNRGKRLSIEARKKISSALKGRKHPDRFYIPKDRLFEMYITENMTKAHIAKLYGVYPGTLNRLLKEYSIVKPGGGRFQPLNTAAKKEQQ